MQMFKTCVYDKSAGKVALMAQPLRAQAALNLRDNSTTRTWNIATVAEMPLQVVSHAKLTLPMEIAS